jgi:hypothetical protein
MQTITPSMYPCADLTAGQIAIVTHFLRPDGTVHADEVTGVGATEADARTEAARVRQVAHVPVPDGVTAEEVVRLVVADEEEDEA